MQVIQSLIEAAMSITVEWKGNNDEQKKDANKSWNMLP